MKSTILKKPEPKPEPVPMWGWRCPLTKCYTTTTAGHFMPPPWKLVSKNVYA